MNIHQIHQTEKNRDEFFNLYEKQYKQIMNDDHQIECAGCNEWFYIRALYRCYFCGLWLCSHCSEKHFGEKPKIGIRYKEV